MRPMILDLFCCAGGAAAGYHRAGFDVVGVDREPQPNYPFEFIQGDALEVGARLLADRSFDAIHASPPCQGYSGTRHIQKGKKHGVILDHPLLIEPTRALLASSGLPYLIENVEGARSVLRDPVLLCGSMFGLDLRRHRLFECSFDIWLTPPCSHGNVSGEKYLTHDRKDKAQESFVAYVYGTGGGAGKDIDMWRRVMDVPWMQTKHEIAEAIPPAFTEFLGELIPVKVTA